MAEQNINDRIEKYIDKIEPVNEGGRDNLLHNTGLLLRKNFGLQGDVLTEWLHCVNNQKCSPPLSHADVVKVARSVDQSDMRAGEGNSGTEPAPNRRRAVKKYTRTEYSVNPGPDTGSVTSLLEKEVSIYRNALENVSVKKSTIGKVLEGFKTGGHSHEHILAIRNESDKEKRNELKKNLPCIVFASKPQVARRNTDCTPNGVLCLDFDNIDNVETARAHIANAPYVFAVGLSAGGNGLFALAHYEGTPNLKNLLSGMQADFRYTIDTSRSDLCGLRFVSLDENLIVKDEVRPAVLTEKIVEVSAPAESKPVKKILGGCFADVKDEPIDWLWKGRFARGHLQQIHGNPDSGKGYFTFWLAGIVSRGGVFPDGEFCKKGSVLIVGTEEHAGYARRKLSAQNTDMRNVHYITGYAEGDEEYPILLSNIDVIQSACDGLKKAGLQVALLIVDPVLQMLGVKSNDNSETQAALAPVKEFAERNNICFLCVNHDGKGQQDTAANRSLGAQSIMGKMRIGYTAKKELKTSQDEEYPLHTLAVSKFNIGRRPKAITYRIVECPDDPEIGKVEILDIDGDFTADDHPGSEKTESKIDYCCQWLEDFLSGGERQLEEIKRTAEAEGYSYGTLKRAKIAIGVQSKKQHFSGQWTWSLKYPSHEVAQAHTDPVAPLRAPLRRDPLNSSVSDIAIHEVAQDMVHESLRAPLRENTADFAPIGLPEFAQFSDSVSGGNLPCCGSCRRTDRPCQWYVPSPAGCGNHQAKEGAF